VSVCRRELAGGREVSVEHWDMGDGEGPWAVVVWNERESEFESVDRFETLQAAVADFKRRRR
jgi:hypothetical protein